jgi:hypothetical protein
MSALAIVPQNGSLLEIYRMIIDDNFRESIEIDDDAVREFWRETFPMTMKKDKGRLNPPTNKLRKLVMSKICRLTLCQSAPKFDLMKEMNADKIIICNFGKGALGHDMARLFAALMMSKIEMCAFRRSPKSKPFFVFADEFQNYVTKTFPNLLSESRKYRIGVNLYHQYMSQVKPEMAHAIRGTVGSRYAFRCEDDAETVADMFESKRTISET